MEEMVQAPKDMKMVHDFYMLMHSKLCYCNLQKIWEEGSGTNGFWLLFYFKNEYHILLFIRAIQY